MSKLWLQAAQAAQTIILILERESGAQEFRTAEGWRHWLGMTDTEFYGCGLTRQDQARLECEWQAWYDSQANKQAN